MNNEVPARKKLPFASEKESRQFEHELALLLIKEFDARLRQHIPPENQEIFHHGRQWNFQRQEKNGFSPQTGAVKRQSVTSSIEFDRILSNDVTVVSDFLRNMADGFEKQFIEQTFEAVKAVTEETGNMISVAKTGSLADAFMEGIRTRTMTVGRDGKV